jgi:hypothetical protein
MRSWKRIDSVSAARVPANRSLSLLLAAVAVCLGATHLSAQTSGAKAALPALAGEPDYRSPDQRPQHDDAHLSTLGIASIQSKRLKLYSDGPLDRLKSIGPAVDALYDALVEYFGPLPPARDKSEFAVTGYLMTDKSRFRNAGLLPEELPPFLNGRHRGLEFWVNEQETDYYRRHLILHEFTHCFMYAPEGVEMPVWYSEGMAELFGTHTVDAAGHYQFRVMPDRNENFRGHGRIPLIRSEIAANHWKSLRDVTRITAQDFLQTPAYAWSWALCALLDGNPRYSSKFRQLSHHRGYGQFAAAFRELFGDSLDELRTEWSLFSHELQYGFDLKRAAIDFKPGKPLVPNDPSWPIDVAADRGWQSSGVLVRAGAEYEITATGEVTLGTSPKPWISQPPGVSIVYSEGHPIGLLLAAVHREPPATDPATEESMLRQIAVGRGVRFTPSVGGTLYFRINDHWNSLADNDGHYRVTVRELSAPK